MCVCVCVCVCVWSVAVPWVIINRRRSWYGRATGALQSMVSQGALGHLPQPVHSMGEVGDGGVEEGLSWEYCGSATSLKPTWNLHKVLRQRMNTRTQSPSKGSSQSIAVKEHKHKLGRSKVKNYLHLKHIIAYHSYVQKSSIYSVDSTVSSTATMVSKFIASYPPSWSCALGTRHLRDGQFVCTRSVAVKGDFSVCQVLRPISSADGPCALGLEGAG